MTEKTRKSLFEELQDYFRQEQEKLAVTLLTTKTCKSARETGVCIETCTKTHILLVRSMRKLSSKISRPSPAAASPRHEPVKRV